MEKKIVLNTIVSLLKNGVAKFEYRSELSTLNDELKEVHADVGVFKRSKKNNCTILVQYQYGTVVKHCFMLSRVVKVLVGMGVHPSPFYYFLN